VQRLAAVCEAEFGVGQLSAAPMAEQGRRAGVACRPAVTQARHTYSSYARGADVLWGMYQRLNRAPLGRNESGPWFRRKDEYNEG
jgi:predicted dithiol-disulfide oxidoreductase (DUF899 family)